MGQASSFLAGRMVQRPAAEGCRALLSLEALRLLLMEVVTPGSGVVPPELCTSAAAAAEQHSLALALVIGCSGTPAADTQVQAPASGRPQAPKHLGGGRGRTGD